MSEEAGNSSALDGNVTICCLDVYDSAEFKAVAVVRAGTGSFSLFCSLAIVGYMLYYQKYKLVLNQRLVLLLAISVSFHSFSYLVGRVQFTTPRPIVDSYCSFASFLELLSGWTEILSVLCISYNFLHAVTFGQNNKNRKLARVYALLIFLLPLFWCWLPWVHFSWGSSGPWCGIRVFSKDCKQFNLGLSLRWLLQDVPLMAVFITTIIFSVATWLMIKWKIHSKKAAYLPNQNQVTDTTLALKEIEPFLWYPPVYACLQLFFLINHIYENISPTPPPLPLWYLQATVSPLAGTSIALACLLNSEMHKVCSGRWGGVGCSKVKWCFLWLCYKPSTQEAPRQLQAKVKPYVCDLCLNYGDSMEGAVAQRRMERIKRNSNNSLKVTEIVETSL